MTPEEYLLENGLNDLVISHPHAGEQYVKYVSDAIRGYQKATEAQKQPAMSLEECKQAIADKYMYSTFTDCISGLTSTEGLRIVEKRLDEVAELYANQFREEQKWVDIDEKQPQPLQNVLLSHDVAKWVVEGYMSKDGFFYGVSDCELDIYPSHWKSLPKAP